MLNKFLMIGSLAIISCSSTSFSQVVIGGETEEVKEPKKKKVVEEKEGATEVYLVSNWSNTRSILRENEGLYSKPLGEREFETSLNTWSFGLGFRTEIHKYFSLQAGVAYLRNGESYLFEDVDTMFTYNSTYAYIAMPIKGLFTYGDGVKLLAGGGITPQLFSGYRQDTEWTTKNNSTDKETIKLKNGFSTFVLSASFNIGVQLRLSPTWSLLLMPEYRIQLTDSYVVTDRYEHFARAFGFDMGLTLKL
jgi:hypothetical protein